MDNRYTENGYTDYRYTNNFSTKKLAIRFLNNFVNPKHWQLPQRQAKKRVLVCSFALMKMGRTFSFLTLKMR
jgi:hypothetical protein